MNHLHLIFIFVHIYVGYSAGTTKDTVLCAVPAANDSCPENDNIITCDYCLTISQYAQNSDTYFSANSKLIFLEGEHKLNENFILHGGENFTTLTLEGKPWISRIHIEKSVTFAIFDLQNLAIVSLEFLENSIFSIGNSKAVTVSNVCLSETGLSFENIDQLIALNLTVFNASGVLFTLLNIQESNAEFTNLNVEKNSGKSIVLVNQSSIQFTGTVFKDNTAVESSSLTITSSSASFEGRNQFYMNSCENDGGAMRVADSTVIFHHRTDFIANTAKESGGALNVRYSFLIFSGLLTAKNNSVSPQFSLDKLFGGFMSSFWSNVTISGTAIFEDNYIDGLALCLGGAIAVRMSTLALSGSIEFRSNHAKCISSHGGAIALINSILTAVDIHFKFSKNTALSTGGAISLLGESVNYNQFTNNTLHISGTSLLEANQVSNTGGAIYGDGTFNVNFTGNTSLVNSDAMMFGSHIAFSFGVESHASFNGRTELKHAYSASSMVTVSDDTQVIFCGETIIENNTALDGTGVLVNDNGAYYQFVGQTIFQGNKGIVLALHHNLSSDQPLLFGEALFIDNDVSISLISSKAHLVGDFRFMRNTGPCIIIAQSSNITFNGTMAFESNSADSGSAISSISSTVYMNSDNIFHNNSAQYDGGSVYLTDSNFYLNADHKFIANSAKRGGVVCAINSNVHLSGDLMFTQNYAEPGGVFALGVYAILHLSNLSINLTKNMAKEGGIIYVEDVFNSIDCSDDSALPVPKAFFVRPKCFYSVVKDSHVSIMNSESVATDRGNILFGGNLMRCDNKLASYDFQRLFGLRLMVQTQNISSNPYQIVLCSLDNRIMSSTLRTLPGKRFSVPVVALDQLSQPISSIVRAQLPAQSNYTSRLIRPLSEQADCKWLLYLTKLSCLYSSSKHETDALC